MGHSKRVTRSSVFLSYPCFKINPMFALPNILFFPVISLGPAGRALGRSYPTSAVLPFYTSFIFQISSFYWVYVFDNLNCTRGNQTRNLRKNVPKQSAAGWTFIHLQSAPHIAGFPQAPYARPLTPSTPPLCQLGMVPRPQLQTVGSLQDWKWPVEPHQAVKTASPWLPCLAMSMFESC